MTNGDTTTAPPHPDLHAEKRSVLAILAGTPPWLSIGLFALSIFLLTLPADLRNNGDTVYRFDVTERMITAHTVELGCGRFNDSRLALGRHGCIYAIYGPGQTIAMLPLYGVGKVISVLAGTPKAFAVAVSVRSLDPILGAAALVVYFFLSVLLGFRRRTAVVLTLLVGFATTFWPDVQSGQESTQVTLALLAAVYAAVRAVPSGDVGVDLRSGATSQRWILLSGAAAGFGLFTRYDFAIDALLVAGFLAWCVSAPVRKGGGNAAPVAMRAVALFLMGTLPFALMDAVWNTVRFGAPWRVGESAAAQFGLPLWQGIPNLVVSPGKGLLWYAPVLFLVPFAAVRFFKRAPQLAWLIAFLCIVSVVFYGSVLYWHGDPAWGPRYLFPLVPLLILPLGEIVDRFSRYGPPLQAGILAVITLSLLIQLSAVSVDPWRFWYHLVQETQQSGKAWHWGATKYHYYWKESPVLYQFEAVRDVLQIAEGSKTPVPFDPACVRFAGVSCRPINTISPIWLNERYQWQTPLLVPLSLLERATATSILILVAALSSLAIALALRRPLG